MTLTISPLALLVIVQVMAMAVAWRYSGWITSRAARAALTFFWPLLAALMILIAACGVGVE